MLESECQSNAQVAYQTLCLLWILSYHEETYTYFQDFGLEITEKCAKILDFHNKEKIVRIFLMLLDNLKEVEGCEEHMSDIDALTLVNKLKNRYWVDPDLTSMLEEMQTFLEDHQKEYSSLEKFKNQVNRRQLKWGPCHTEDFWKHNAVLFEKSLDNLNLIDIIVNECLSSPTDRTKAVACYDLGEYAKFCRDGKQKLDSMNVRGEMTALMQDEKVSAEVKKEAITCYQKILMDAGTTNSFKD